MGGQGYAAAAVRHLKRSDRTMARLIESVGPCRFRPHTDHSHFHHLARAIVYQQLSSRAAATIFGRVQALCGGATLEPRAVLASGERSLRAAGLSQRKAAYLRDLAGHVLSGRLQLESVERMADSAVIEALTAVRGIGVWSAQMFLMFRLGRPDVLPALDLGIRKAVRRAYRLRAMPAPRHVQRIGAPWSPYATIACWYLWRSLDGPAA